MAQEWLARLRAAVLTVLSAVWSYELFSAPDTVVVVLAADQAHLTGRSAVLQSRTGTPRAAIRALASPTVCCP